jgi:hypothetical protein
MVNNCYKKIYFLWSSQFFQFLPAARHFFDRTIWCWRRRGSEKYRTGGNFFGPRVSCNQILLGHALIKLFTLVTQRTMYLANGAPLLAHPQVLGVAVVDRRNLDHATFMLQQSRPHYSKSVNWPLTITMRTAIHCSQLPPCVQYLTVRPISASQSIVAFTITGSSLLRHKSHTVQVTAVNYRHTKYYTRQEVVDRGKYGSILQYGFNYSCKKGFCQRPVER